MSSHISNLEAIEATETVQVSAVPEIKYWDTKALLTQTRIPILDDGSVELMDWTPRIVPEGRTPEVAIVQAARVSTGAGIKSPQEDTALINRLYRSQHTSPFESVKFVFRIRAPMFVRTHFIRHRMANVNEFSQRYAEIEDDAFYHPSQCPELWMSGETLRVQSGVDKQASIFDKLGAVIQTETISSAFRHAEALCDAQFVAYHDLIKLGVPRELARFCLPNATYTDFYFTMDLNNLLKFLGLRNDPDHAQSETVLYAQAMETLITPLVPSVMKTFLNWRRNALVLSGTEVEAIADGSYTLKTSSVGLQAEFKKKVARLHPNVQRFNGVFRPITQAEYKERSEATQEGIEATHVPKSDIIQRQHQMTVDNLIKSGYCLNEDGTYVLEHETWTRPTSTTTTKERSDQQETPQVSTAFQLSVEQELPDTFWFPSNDDFYVNSKRG
jgi:thymidylate synthase (FAD)